jgi:uncharacterized protein (DUF2336 family)
MSLLERLFGRGKGGDDSLTYEQARELVRHEDPQVRRELAAREDLRPEILYYLAEDPSPEVRREIASNQTTPVQANLLLASDADDGVRSGLAEKIARLAPGLTASEHDRLRRMTYEAIEMLARDQVTRVRQILAEALKDVAGAPPEVINRLARDSELTVAAPVLEYSPVLTDDDLLDIIQSSPIQGALSAISKRSQVHERISDAIAASDDIEAIGLLLGNPSAQIREQTLDRLIDRAPDIEVWHEPLVNRPHLVSGAASRIARFVAENLLHVLESRGDFDAETVAAVAAVVRRRIDEGTYSPREAPQVADETPLAAAKRMHAEGTLTETVIANALGASDTVFVIAALAVLSTMPVEVVRKIVTTQSAKGMTALAWKAGLSMRFAVQLQVRLARVAPGDVLHPKRGTDYPLKISDMKWQLDFFASMGEG